MARLACILVLCAFVGSRAVALNEADSQIVGGAEADIADYPFQVSLRYYGSHKCGGSIVSRLWILTAGHCVDKDVSEYPISSLTVRAGSSSRSTGGKVYQAAATAKHDNYVYFNLLNDVGLVKLSSPFTFSSTIKPITIATTEPAAGDTLTVAGWGLMDIFDYQMPDKLQAVSVPVVSKTVCRQAYAAINYQVTDAMLCAGQSGKAFCSGDSGGAVLNAAGEQVGIVSWSKSCALGKYPGVYANLAEESLASWIKARMA